MTFFQALASVKRSTETQARCLRSCGSSAEVQSSAHSYAHRIVGTMALRSARCLWPAFRQAIRRATRADLFTPNARWSDAANDAMRGLASTLVMDWSAAR